MKTKTYKGYLVSWMYKGEMGFTFRTSVVKANKAINALKKQGIEAKYSNKITFKIPAK